MLISIEILIKIVTFNLEELTYFGHYLKQSVWKMQAYLYFFKRHIHFTFGQMLIHVIIS